MTKKIQIESIVKLPPSMKGYELYLWRNNKKEYFKLITGTNKIKNDSSIFEDEFFISKFEVRILLDDIEDLVNLLTKLPKGCFVSLNSGIWWEKKLFFSVEASTSEDFVIKLSQNLNIFLTN